MIDSASSTPDLDNLEPEQTTKQASSKKMSNNDDGSGPSTTFYLHSLLLFGGRLLHKVLNAYNSLFELNTQEKAKIYRNISTHYAKKGLHDKAIDSLKEWVRLEPTSLDANHQLGLALAAAGRRNEALRFFEKVLKLQPEHKGALFHKSSLMLKMKEYQNAVSGFEKVSAMTENPKVFYLLGIAYDKLGEVEKAIEAMEKAVSLDPNEIKYNQHLGFLNVRKDEHQKAAEYFTKVMELEHEEDV